ncbi:MAG: hypothetical protein OHK0039_19850 [Bacteroidia bacterium]
MGYVFRESSRYCTRTLVKKTGCDLADAEDIFMDALIIFRENLLSGKLQYLSNLRTYMFGICWNCWRDLQRARTRQDQARDEIGRQLLLIRGEKESPFDSDEEDLVRARVRQITQALAQLGDTCRRLLAFVYIDQLPHKEIAERMGLASPNVVKVTRHRCYQQWLKFIAQLEARPHES